MPIRTESGLKLTYEDYAKIPDDGLRHEIIDGRHIVNPAPRPRHQIILRNLYDALRHLQDTGQAEILWSPIDVQLSETDIVQPDLIAIAPERLRLIGELKVDGPPDLVVEVLSPSNPKLDRTDKRALYQVAGVVEYWIVDPDEKALCQLTLIEGRYVETTHTSGEVRSTAFPGTVVSLASVFAQSR